MSDKDRSVVLPLFSGKDEDFQVWWTKFMAFATTKGVEEALMGREDMLPETQRERIDDEDEDQEEKIQARKRNNLAMSYLLAAFKAEADISLAYETMDDDWPGGLAYKVVEKLLDIYRPKDNITEVEVFERLLKVKMKKKEDPKTLFEQVASIQNWYNDASKKLPKGQLIAGNFEGSTCGVCLCPNIGTREERNILGDLASQGCYEQILLSCLQEGQRKW